MTKALTFKPVQSRVGLPHKISKNPEKSNQEEKAQQETNVQKPVKATKAEEELQRRRKEQLAAKLKHRVENSYREQKLKNIERLQKIPQWFDSLKVGPGSNLF